VERIELPSNAIKALELDDKASAIRYVGESFGVDDKEAREIVDNYIIRQANFQHLIHAEKRLADASENFNNLLIAVAIGGLIYYFLPK
jgi:hypothetical protein